MARRRREGACPRAPAVTCFPPEFAPCLPVPPMSDGKGHETAHREIRGGTFLPHCRSGGPLGGVTGNRPAAAGRHEASRFDRPLPRVRQAHDREGVVPLWTVPRERSFGLRTQTGELHTPRRGEDAADGGVRTSPPVGVTGRFDSRRTAATDVVQTRGGYREWSDRIPTGAIPERSGGRLGDASMT